MICDLHTHSTASDGQYTPSELVHLAKAAGLELLALTDHDTVDGLDEAVCAGKALGLRVLRGVELSVPQPAHSRIRILQRVLRPDPALFRDEGRAE